MKTRSHSALWLLVPWALGFVLLTLIPLLASLVLSLTRVDGRLSADSLTWVGFDHYRRALGVDAAQPPETGDPWYWQVVGGRPRDPRVYTALSNSLIYTVFAVPLGLCFSLAAALLMNRPARGMSVARTCVYLPHVLGGVATIVIWSWLFNPQFGWINEAIRCVYALVDPVARLFSQGGTADWPVPRWLYSPGGCKPAVVIMHIWTVGGAMLIFLAALRRVAPELNDAAALDGAGAWQRFRCVTIPQITPAILFNLTVAVIFTMQSFSEAYLLQNRAQDEGLLFYVLYLYRVAFEPPYRLGYAAALSWILVAVLFVVIVPLLWTSRRWVFEAIGDRV